MCADVSVERPGNGDKRRIMIWFPERATCLALGVTAFGCERGARDEFPRTAEARRLGYKFLQPGLNHATKLGVGARHGSHTVTCASVFERLDPDAGEAVFGQLYDLIGPAWSEIVAEQKFYHVVLCAVTAQYLAQGKFQAYGDAATGFIVTPTPAG